MGIAPETIVKNKGDRNPAPQLPKLKFNEDRSFETELHNRVNNYFATTGKHPTATVTVYVKAFFMLVFFFSMYLLLVFAADTASEGIIFSILLGFAVVGIGADLQHDGSHGAFSTHHAINKMMAMTLDLVGASSYFWQWKHNRIHHTFTNVGAFDTDINFGALCRIAPTGKRLWYQRWQQFYLWPFYGLLTIKWQLFDDFKSLIAGRLGNHRIPRPQGFDLVWFIAGKIWFVTLGFVVPLLYHPPHLVFFCYLLSMSMAGFILSMIFVLPHCVVESEFPVPDAMSGRIEYPRAVHQVRVTVDFARKSTVLTVLAGGLNYHREHHLFPGVCHVHYQRISGIIDEVCNQFNVPHVEHGSYLAGLASHYRRLRNMGRPDAAAGQLSNL